jgi:bifunctional DNA-binding transcriptional regulator/antitoxin component of YhaV-PrlF toxin-antitoxin module
LLYAPVSNSGLVTLPKAAREFIQLIPGEDALKLTPASGNCIVIAKHKKQEEVDLTKPVRLTQKGQFSISGKYRSWLQLNEDAEVSFTIQNEQLVMSKAGKTKDCLACHTTGRIQGIECCICKGTGKTRSHPAGILAEIFVALIDGRKYEIAYSLINHQQLPDGSVTLLDLPKFTVLSATKPPEYVAAIQEHYEKCIKDEYSKLKVRVDVLEV